MQIRAIGTVNQNYQSNQNKKMQNPSFGINSITMTDEFYTAVKNFDVNKVKQSIQAAKEKFKDFNVNIILDKYANKSIQIKNADTGLSKFVVPLGSLDEGFDVVITPAAYLKKMFNDSQINLTARAKSELLEGSNCSKYLNNMDDLKLHILKNVDNSFTLDAVTEKTVKLFGIVIKREQPQLILSCNGENVAKINKDLNAFDFRDIADIVEQAKRNAHLEEVKAEFNKVV